MLTMGAAAASNARVPTFNSGKVFHLDHHEDYRRRIDVALSLRDFAKLPPRYEDSHEKGHTCVTETAEHSAGAPEMIVGDPGWLKVLSR
jgi:hypothetical protein